MPPRKKTTTEDLLETMRGNVDEGLEPLDDNPPADESDDFYPEHFHPESNSVDIMVSNQKFSLTARSGSTLEMVDDTVKRLEMLLDAAYNAADVGDFEHSFYSSVEHQRVSLWSYDPVPVRTLPTEQPVMVKMHVFHENSDLNESLRLLRLLAVYAEERANFQRTMAAATGQKPPYIPSEPPKFNSGTVVHGSGERRPLGRSGGYESRTFGGFDYTDERSMKTNAGSYVYVPNFAVTVDGEKGQVDAAVVPPIIARLTDIGVPAGRSVLLPIGQIEHNKRNVDKGDNPGRKELYYLRIPKAAHLQNAPFAIEVFVDNDRLEPLLKQLDSLEIELTEADDTERWLLATMYQRRSDGKVVPYPVRLVEPDMETIWKVDVGYVEPANDVSESEPDIPF